MQGELVNFTFESRFNGMVLSGMLRIFTPSVALLTAAAAAAP
jgi:hypothetical protein